MLIEFSISGIQRYVFDIKVEFLHLSLELLRTSPNLLFSLLFLQSLSDIKAILAVQV